MECCSCKECMFLTKKRIHAEEGLPEVSRKDFNRQHLDRGEKEPKCTEANFYLPFLEREDDEGDYPPDEHYIEVTGPALEEGIQAMEEGMKE